MLNARLGLMCSVVRIAIVVRIVVWCFCCIVIFRQTST